MLRIGLMGAAKIAPSAIVAPCKASTNATVTAIGARDRARAEAFATKHGIPRIHDTYDALLADPDIDAVYIPLPNGLHGKWAIKAVQAGKHVLCEKPLAANEAEAQAMTDAAGQAGRVLMEAFHYRYHPLAQRMKDIVGSGELGETREIYSTMCFPLPLFGDIRYNFALGGGAMMDAGCYTVHMARLVGGGEPEVLSAKPLLRQPRGRPRDEGRPALPVRRDRACACVDVVMETAGTVAARRRQQGRDAGQQSDRSAGLPQDGGQDRGRKTRRAFQQAAELCLPAGRLRRRLRAWHPDADPGQRRGEEHARD